MKVITAEEPLPGVGMLPDQVISNGAIFLIGPTPRDPNTPSWRPEAIKILKELEFRGQVYVPERESWQCDYLDQVEWEHRGLEIAADFGCVAAWVPRDLETMPAFTTNVEFGYYVDCGRFAYGRPEDAPKTRYLDWLYQKETGQSPVASLFDLMRQAVGICGEP